MEDTQPSTWTPYSTWGNLVKTGRQRDDSPWRQWSPHLWKGETQEWEKVSGPPSERQASKERLLEGGR